MKKYFLLFVVGLLACAGSREPDLEESYALYLGNSSEFILSQERDLTGSKFIVATPNTPYRMSAKDSTLLAALLSAPAPDKIADERNAQKFSVHVNIAFPKMTLQQAAELEARLKKLLPEAQEINLDLGQDVEVPVDEFYYVPEGAESRTVPGFYPPLAPLKGLKPGRFLQVDSTSAPVWQEF